MSKLNKLKQALKNPPPERLAKIEYKSHLYQAFGITFVCILLIYKGFWYIIFAFLFGVGISYSQGMTAYKKYQMIKSIQEPEKIEDYQNDISPTRRRSKIIKEVMPIPKLLAAILSVLVTVLVINPSSSRWILMLVYPLVISVFYFVIYFFIFYWISYPFYKRRLKV